MAKIIAHKTKEIQLLKRELISQEEELRESYESKRVMASQNSQNSSNSRWSREEQAREELTRKEEEIVQLKTEREQLASIVSQKNT